MSENNNARFYSYQCPNCGADMELSIDQKSIVCEYCGKKLYFANTNNANDPNAQPQLMVQDEKRRLQQTLNSAARARKIILVIYITIFVFVFGCVAVSVIAGFNSVSSSRRTASTTLKEVNPFKGLQVEITGVAPYAKVQSVKGTAVRNAQFKADKTEGLSNGDVITITVDDMYGYSWTETSYQYTVSGLDTLVVSPSEIPQDDVETIQNFGADKIKKSWTKAIDLDESEYQLTITPCAMYMSVSKQYSYRHNNYVMVEYQIDFVFGEATGTVYNYVSIPDAILSADGSFSLAYDDLSVEGDSLWLEEYGVTLNHGYIWVNGFDSVLEMESDMQDQDYQLVKE